MTLSRTTPQIKICGLKTQDTIEAALNAKVDHIGFVFYPQSPRLISLDKAEHYGKRIQGNASLVGLFVNPSFDLLDEVLNRVPLDILQFHGSERPENLALVKERYGKKIMKGLSVGTVEDLRHTDSYTSVCDWLLLDSPPTGDVRVAGGSGLPFDWSILRHFRPKIPWMLAGGLNAQNVLSALDQCLPDGVDVSSGVEKTRGEKDPEKIHTFVRTIKEAFTDRTLPLFKAS